MSREPEHVEQKQLFRWAALHEQRVPELRWLYAVPNGRKRSPAEAGKLKAEGVKAGVLDVHLPVARLGFHGCVVEMKAPGELNDTSPEQREWIEHFEREGYNVSVYDRWQLAWNGLMWYLCRSELRISPHLIPPLSAPIRSRTRARRA